MIYILYNTTCIGVDCSTLIIAVYVTKMTNNFCLHEKTKFSCSTKKALIDIDCLYIGHLCYVLNRLSVKVSLCMYNILIGR